MIWQIFLMLLLHSDSSSLIILDLGTHKVMSYHWQYYKQLVSLDYFEVEHQYCSDHFYSLLKEIHKKLRDT